MSEHVKTTIDDYATVAQRQSEVERADVVPFGGADAPTDPRWRPNQCICGRSMSDRWPDDRCAFCAVVNDDE